jgi:two-component system response regulator FixJ
MSDAVLFIVDDDDAVRDSLEALLQAKGYAVRTFASGQAFLDQVEWTDRPGCLLLDIRMPGLDGMKVLEKLKKPKLPFPVVMITGHGDVSTAVRAMKAGASDFVEKPFTQDVILSAVTKALESANNHETSAVDRREIADRAHSLSGRERDVMERLVDGLTNKEIARELNISPRTVEVDRAGVMEKMQASNLSSLVKMGLTIGFGKDL